MANVLFATWDGGGNVAPALETAGALARLGDRVRFLGRPSQRGAIESAGFGFEPYRKPGAWTAVGDRNLMQNSVAFLGVLTNRGFGDDLLASVGSIPTDVVVIDCLLYGPTAEGRRKSGAPLRGPHALLVRCSQPGDGQQMRLSPSAIPDRRYPKILDCPIALARNRRFL